jgi:hypothetical protein
MIRHIVTWKFVSQDPAERSAAFDALAQGFGALPAVIPEIRALHLGRDLDETDGNWDLALVIDFASTAHLDVYQTHPEHVKVKELVRSLTGERASIDFEF